MKVIRNHGPGWLREWVLPPRSLAYGARVKTVSSRIKNPCFYARNKENECFSSVIDCLVAAGIIAIIKTLAALAAVVTPARNDLTLPP